MCVVYFVCSIMRFIKRLVFILILLVIAFFIYRLISPLAAQSLLSDLKSFSNTTIGTHFILSTETVIDTWTTLDMTGVVLQNTWGLQEITGDDDFLLTDVDYIQDDLDTWDYISWMVDLETSPSLPTTSSPLPPEISIPTTGTPKPTPVVPSSQSNSDLDKFLQNFGK